MVGSTRWGITDGYPTAGAATIDTLEVNSGQVSLPGVKQTVGCLAGFAPMSSIELVTSNGINYSLVLFEQMDSSTLLI